MTLRLLLDFSVASDTIDHGILLQRLAWIGIRGLVLNWFQSFLEDRVQKAQLEKEFLAPWTLKDEMLQGSSISPMLFNIFMLSCWERSSRDLECIAISIMLTTTHLCLSFTSSAVEAVQDLKHCLSVVLEWMKANSLKLNAEKMEVVL